MIRSGRALELTVSRQSTNITGDYKVTRNAVQLEKYKAKKDKDVEVLTSISTIDSTHAIIISPHPKLFEKGVVSFNPIRMPGSGKIIITIKKFKENSIISVPYLCEIHFVEGTILS